jgi:lambda repressor-like predicted transcriptional regulator
MKVAERKSDSRFGVAVRALVVVNPALTRQNGNPDWMALTRLSGLDYETLRKAVTGERPVSERIMIALAKALKVKPTYFLEYRLKQAQDDFDPQVVGLEQAIRNAEVFLALRPISGHLG